MSPVLLLAQESANSWNFLSGMRSGDMTGAIIVGVSCLTAILITSVIVISASASAIAKHREEVDLKREMLDRGMSPEDIERVLRAGSEGKKPN